MSYFKKPPKLPVSLTAWLSTTDIQRIKSALELRNKAPTALDHVDFQFGGNPTLLTNLTIHQDEKHVLIFIAERAPAQSPLSDKEIESQLEPFSEQVPFIFWAARESGEIIYLNQHGRVLFDLERTKDGIYDFAQFIHPEDLPKAIEGRDHSLATGSVYQLDQRYWIEAKKEYRYYHVRSTPITSGTSKRLWYGVAFDVHEQKMAQLELESNQRRLSILFENLPGVVYQCKNETGWPMQFISSGVEKLLNEQPESFTTGKLKYEDFIHPDYRQIGWDTVQNAIDNNSSFEIIYPIMQGEHQKWVWEQGHAINTGNDEVIIEGLILDISTRIEAEESLKAQNTFINGVARGIPGMLYVYDLKKRQVEYSNERVAEFTGYTVAEVNRFKNGPLELLHPSDIEAVEKSIQKALASSSGKSVSFEHRLRTKQKGYKWFKTSMGVLDKSDEPASRIVVITYDINEQKQIEQELRKSEENTRAILDGTLHTFYLIDKDLQIIHFNQFAYNEVKELLNIELEVGMSFRALVPPEIKANFEEHVKMVLNGETYEVINQYNAGKIQGWYKLIMKPVVNANGQIDSFVFSSMDLTRLFRAQEELKKKESLLNSINQNLQEGLYRRQAGGKIVYVNDAFARMFGYKDSAEFLLQDDHQLYKNPEVRKDLARIVLKKGELSNQEIEFVDRHGQTFWGLLSSRLSEDEFGNRVYDGAIVHITDLKKMREELEEAKENAEEMNRLKSSFLANMSHEIRTPINGIIGLAQIMEETDDQQEMQSYIDLLKHSSERLLNTITSILDFSRLEANQMKVKLEKLDFSALVHSTKPMFALLANEKNISLDYALSDDEHLVLADENMLLQLINNLIGNAIKFTDQGFVRITLEILEKKDERFIQLDVTDTGKGISESFLPKIFQPFRQESSGVSRAHEGSGLGLSIARRYATLLGGDLTVQSELGKGSTFTLLLPLVE